jgi:hypothetical protein
MKKGQPLYRQIHKASAIAMILALLWLTVSAPFVNAVAMEQFGYQDIAGDCSIPCPSNDEEAPAPFGNSTEEKAGSTSFSEEYLHGHDKADHFLTIASLKYMSGHADTYHAYHGEVQVPPPNFS